MSSTRKRLRRNASSLATDDSVHPALPTVEPLEPRLLLSGIYADPGVLDLDSPDVSALECGLDPTEKSTEDDGSEGALYDVWGAPDAPSGPATGEVGQSLSYSTSGFLNDFHDFEYDWGDGTRTEEMGGTTQSHTYDAAGTYTIRVRENCPFGLFDSDWSDPTQVTITGGNTAPTVDNPIADQDASEDAAFSFAFGSDAFSDVDDGDTLTYAATQADGSDLPGWLSFDANTRTFSGTPADADVGSIDIKVTATDPLGATASDEFTITIANTYDAEMLIALRWNGSTGVQEVQTLDLSTGELATLGDLGDLASWNGQSIFDSANGLLYVSGISSGGTATLYTFDVADGEVTNQAALGLAGLNLAGLDADGDLIGLAWSSTDAAQNIYRIDAAAGTADKIGEVGDLQAWYGQSTIDTSSNTLYVLGMPAAGTPTLYEINLSTGGLTAQHTLPRGDLSVAGLDHSGNLIALGWDGSASTQKVYRITPGTGAVETIGSVSDLRCWGGRSVIDGTNDMLYLNGLSAGGSAQLYTFNLASEQVTNEEALAAGCGSFLSHGTEALIASIAVDEDFSDGIAADFDAQSGTWTVSGGTYNAVADADQAAITLLSDSSLPSALDFEAVLNADPSSGSYWSNAFLIFDYQSPTDFKYAAIYIGRGTLEIGHRDADGWTTDTSTNVSLSGGTDYSLAVSLDGSQVTATLVGLAQISHTYSGSLTDGRLGLATDNACAHFDNVQAG